MAARKPSKVARRSPKGQRKAKGAPAKRRAPRAPKAAPLPPDGIDPSAFRSAPPAPKPEPRAIDHAGRQGDTLSQDPDPREAYGS